MGDKSYISIFGPWVSRRPQLLEFNKENPNDVLKMIMDK